MAAHLRQLAPNLSAQHFFGAELRHRRTEAGLSQAALAGKVFVTANMVAKVEAAQRFPSLNLATRSDTVLDAGGALMRLYAFAVAERDEHRRLRQQSGLDVGEIMQLRRLLATITMVRTVEPSVPSLDVLDLIDGALSSAGAMGAQTDRVAVSRGGR
ncbi:transcriptional regulator with XRE-family HTH domain [Hamadaea flava]|uniref:Multiprotein-bridging factor 1 family protein n=1 Tax=Hamadaea flava TaxID=1742688 RepID=A0ABV8LZF2_9ACTN|nr:helix-turn-helix transcriptional regulator [Hamadaea flava]MCP2326955.1 transcriptional regulator with XRE-family HTH domain [Hamadaea flava]